MIDYLLKPGGYLLELVFNDGFSRKINFEPVFRQLKGDYAKWFNPINFNRVQLKDGNIFWGKNEDVIFTIESLYSGSIEKEKI